MKFIMLRKKIFLLFIFQLSVLSSYCQKEKQILNAEYIEKSVVKITPGMFAGKYEVNNWLYRQFINDLSIQKKKNELEIARIDSTGWLQQPVYIAALSKQYHTDKQYDEFPVVNITYEAANLFCEWLTQKYNSFPDRKYNKVSIRLPKEVEWIQAAKGKNPGSIYPTGPGLKNKDSIPMANYKRTDLPVWNNPNMPDPGDLLMLAPVKSYWPCSYGIYNMAGNAAEMIAEKGVTKGGGFIDTELAMYLESKGQMQAQASHIGFRYFLFLSDQK